MASIDGTTGADSLIGTSEADIIAGMAGNDFIDGLAGADRMSGGRGDDAFIVDNASDVVIEREDQGSDEIRASVSYRLPAFVEKLVLLGDSAINATGNSLNNILIGNDAANIFKGDGGADVFIGGGGDDLYHVTGVVTEIDGGYIFEDIDQVVELDGGGTDRVISNVTYRLGENVENLTLTGSLDLAGFGNSADNTIIGNAGANLLIGDDGSDWLDGGAGADLLSGGDGSDTYVIDNVGDTITPESPAASGGIDLVRSSIDFALPHSIENLTLTGTAGISGAGNSGDNIIRGNDASNGLSGGGGADTVLGGGGNDTVGGGSGRDVVAGGLGADEFVFGELDFAGLTASTADRIRDFDSSQGDAIALDSVDANRLVDGDQQFNFIGSASFHDVAGELRYQQISGNTYVMGDTNGDGAADFMIRLDGLHALASEDFII